MTDVKLVPPVKLIADSYSRPITSYIRKLTESKKKR